MFAECQEYLVDKLRQAGVRTNIITTNKALALTRESHLGAVIFDEETFLRNGSKKVYKDQTGATRKRRKVFDRGTAFSVIIGDYKADAVDITLARFLALLDRGIYIDGNYVPIDLEASEWVDKDDSVINAKVAVNLRIIFRGGVYKDSPFAHISDVGITDVEKEKE